MSANPRIVTNPRQLRNGRQIGLVPGFPDSPASIERVNVNDINVANYQRHIKPAKLKKMIREWEPARAGWIIISRRADGTLYVVDGQHRSTALSTLQGKHGPYIDAIVVEGWSLEQEANYFLTQSAEYRSSILPHDIHNAALYAGDDRAIEIEHIVAAAGFRIGKRNVAPGESGELRTVKAIYDVFDRYGPAVLRDTLVIVAEAWGRQSHPEQCVVSGVALFLGMYPQADVAAVPRRPALVPLPVWLNAAKAHARSERMSMTEGVAYKLRSDFNWKRTKNLLPDFDDTLREHRFAIRSNATRERNLRDGTRVVKKSN